MSNKKLEFIRLGFRKRGASTRLKLRWDMSPKSCEIVSKLLPCGGQAFHAKHASNEVYALVPLPDELTPGEWATVYPGAGDMLFIPIALGPPLPAQAKSVISDRGVLDLAYFYDRGNSLIGPYGVNFGNIFATATSIEEMEAFAVVCNDVWFRGADGETMYVEAA